MKVSYYQYLSFLNQIETSSDELLKIYKCINLHM